MVKSIDKADYEQAIKRYQCSNGCNTRKLEPIRMSANKDHLIVGKIRVANRDFREVIICYGMRLSVMNVVSF